MNRDDLVAQVESYAKRTDLTGDILSSFLPLAEARIGRDLKSAENETIVELPAVSDNPFDLPEDYGQIRALTVAQNRGPKTLVSVDLAGAEQAGGVSVSKGNVLGYEPR